MKTIRSTVEGLAFTLGVERRERTSQFGISGRYLFARIEGPKYTYLLTKGSDERSWYVDAHFQKGIPIFVHGEGSRCCMKRIIGEGPFFHALEDLAKGV